MNEPEKVKIYAQAFDETRTIPYTELKLVAEVDAIKLDDELLLDLSVELDHTEAGDNASADEWLRSFIKVTTHPPGKMTVNRGRAVLKDQVP